MQPYEIYHLLIPVTNKNKIVYRYHFLINFEPNRIQFHSKSFGKC